MRISDWSSDVCSSDLKGWDKTWAFLRELDKYVEYYPSGTTATMRELAQGSRDLIASTMGWDIYPRVQGIVPKEAAVVAFDNPTFVTDGQLDRKSTRLNSSH